MRGYIVSFVAAGMLLSGSLPASAQSIEIAYIDSRKVLAEAPGTREASESFDKELAQYQAELQQLEEEIKGLLADYDQKRVTLSPEAKRQREEEIQRKEQEYRRRAAQLEQQASQRQAELVEPIMEQIHDVLEGIRQEQGYTMIFDVASAGIVAADPSLDITDLVLERLKATSPDTASNGNPGR